MAGVLTGLVFGIDTFILFFEAVCSSFADGFLDSESKLHIDDIRCFALGVSIKAVQTSQLITDVLARGALVLAGLLLYFDELVEYIFRALVLNCSLILVRDVAVLGVAPVPNGLPVLRGGVGAMPSLPALLANGDAVELVHASLHLRLRNNLEFYI